MDNVLCIIYNILIYIYIYTFMKNVYNIVLLVQKKSLKTLSSKKDEFISCKISSRLSKVSVSEVHYIFDQKTIITIRL